MKKIIPLLTLAAMAAAAGSAAGLARTKEPSNVSTQADDAPELETFCLSHWGTMNERGNVCRFEQTIHFNLTHVGGSLLITPLPLLAGDSVSLLASDDAVPVVGTREYPAKNFVSGSEGYLSFHSASQNLFTVKQVKLERCYSGASGSIETVVCPK